MKLVADECVPAPIIAALRDSGHEVVAIRDPAPGATEGEVLKVALELDGALLTEDLDSGEMVFTCFGTNAGRHSNGESRRPGAGGISARTGDGTAVLPSFSRAQDQRKSWGIRTPQCPVRPPLIGQPLHVVRHTHRAYRLIVGGIPRLDVDHGCAVDGVESPDAKRRALT